MIPLAVLAAVAVLGTGGPPQVVHPDGRIGRFRLDVTTKAQLVGVLGKPARSIVAVTEPTGKRIGERLVYACRPGCDTFYSFSDTTGALSDFVTDSPAVRTERGSHVGLSATRASQLEHKPLVPSCSSPKVIHVRWDSTHAFVVSTLHDRVSSISFFGPLHLLRGLLLTGPPGVRGLDRE